MDPACDQPQPQDPACDQPQPQDPACDQPQPQDLNGLVADFAGRVPEVLHAVVLSSDGLPLAGSARMQQSVYADWVSAVGSGLASLARGAERISGYGPVIQSLVAMEWCTLVTMAIDDVASLAVLTTAADLDMVAYAMTMLVEQAASLTAPAAGGVRDVHDTARLDGASG